jgi:hypothetical protein
LGDKLHLNRENALNQLETTVFTEILRKEDSTAEARSIMIDVIKIMFNSTRWEDRFGAI